MRKEVNVKKFLLGLALLCLLSSPVLAAYCTNDDTGGFKSTELRARDDDGTCDLLPFYVDIGLMGLLEFESKRLEANAVEVLLSSDGYYAGGRCICTAAAGAVRFYDLATTTLSGIPIDEIGCPAVASDTKSFPMPAGIVLKFDAGLTASTTAGILCYGIYKDEP